MKHIILVILALTIASLSHAKERDTSVEETRGAVAGLLIGATIAGPLGAGVGAMIGGGVLGKLVGINRINSELESELQREEANVSNAKIQMHAMAEKNRMQQERLRNSVVDLNKDLDKLLEVQANSWNHRQLPVQFRTASTRIETHYQSQLVRMALVLSRNQDARVMLSGFSDRRGDIAYNQKLSENRVKEVSDFLLARGVKPNQILSRAFGESQPLKDVETVEDNFFDRRVVLDLSLDVAAQLATR